MVSSIALAALGGLSAGQAYSKLGDVDTVPRLGFGQAFGAPRMLQFRGLGGDLASLRISGRDFRNLPKGEGFKIGRGKSRQFFRAPSVEEMRSQARAFERRRIDDERNSLRELQNSPLYDSLLGDAQGTTSRFAQSVTELGRRALGGAAASGLNIRDAAVQARALGPGALQGYLAQRGLQRQAGMTGLSLTRGGGTPTAALAPEGVGQLRTAMMQRFAANQGAFTANANARNQANAVQAGMLANIGGGLMNLGAMGSMGGGAPAPQSGYTAPSHLQGATFHGYGTPGNFFTGV